MSGPIPGIAATGVGASDADGSRALLHSSPMRRVWARERALTSAPMQYRYTVAR